ncbi:hypothetical protein B0H11DRAFT_2062008 [Mycena galericulata]|nr:hypothetical protein B0H11DRAFT_2062008 [Mycena galericulata]
MKELGICSISDDSRGPSTSYLGGLRVRPGTLDKSQYTEEDAMADAEALYELRKSAPSPVATELCYDSWDAGEVSLLFKNTGIIEIRDFAYPSDDPRHRGCTPPPTYPEEQKVAPAPVLEVLALPATPSPKHQRPIKPLPRRASTRTLTAERYYDGDWLMKCHGVEE